MKCDFCKSELQNNVTVLGVFGLFQTVLFYCPIHGIAYTKGKEKRLKEIIKLRK